LELQIEAAQNEEKELQKAQEAEILKLDQANKEEDEREAAENLQKD
jgi:hypothetical protein